MRLSIPIDKIRRKHRTTPDMRISIGNDIIYIKDFTTNQEGFVARSDVRAERLMQRISL